MAAPEDDVAAIEGARAGDRGCLEVLWARHRRWVAAILVSHAQVQRAELEDLLQEVAICLVRGVRTLRDAASFRPWLRTLALNALRTAVRRQHRRPEQPLDVEELPLAAAEHAHGGPHAERCREVLAALGQLPTSYREPLLLRAVEGMSQRAIADALGLSEATVETRLARARRRLREVFARRDAEGDAIPGASTATECSASRSELHR
jgi:RNA polymerase sigma-70 factor (ECF subfamily)